MPAIVVVVMIKNLTHVLKNHMVIKHHPVAKNQTIDQKLRFIRLFSFLGGYNA
jgi:hypothetical protein|tara:strand:+ start:18651 stop:18809 length:159 start_codon:yes stop_codon:yes gene_type:complete